ncbi:hypothetical protein DFH29DRAFT_787437, partial [Suillus ampliporus]
QALIQRSEAGSDPLALFTKYLSSRDSRFPLHPFLWVRSDGFPPTRSWFIRQLRPFFPDDISDYLM